MPDLPPIAEGTDPIEELRRIADGLKDLPAAIAALSKQMEEVAAMQRVLAMGPERVCEFLFEDRLVRMHLPFAAFDKVQRAILQRATFFEARLLIEIGRLMPPGAVVLDAGANIGNHTVFFSMFAGAAEVHAFEPMRETFAILARNVALNRLSNVRCVNAALGAAPGMAAIGIYRPDNIGMTSMALDRPGIYPVTTVDALGLARLDLFKIDVEGAQVEVLRGAEATLRRLSPLVWMELRPHKGEVEPGQAAMAALGYRQLRQLGTTDYLFGPA